MREWGRRTTLRCHVLRRSRYVQQIMLTPEGESFVIQLDLRDRVADKQFKDYHLDCTCTALH
jgi:hypothetical protein